MARQRSDIGLGVIGTGKIGLQRARLAAQHAAVGVDVEVYAGCWSAEFDALAGKINGQG